MKTAHNLSLRAVFLAWLAVTPALGASSAPPAMQKQVTASFVLYLPAGWKAEEGRSGPVQTLRIADPALHFKASLLLGEEPGADLMTLARRQVGEIRQLHPDLALRDTRVSRDRHGLAFAGTFSDGRGGRREMRGWLKLHAGRYHYTTISAPEGQLESIRPTLLTVLANVRALKAATTADTGRAALPPLRPHRLADGSASFSIPEGWRVKELGKGQFIASDKAGTPSFMVASVDVMTPNLGVRVPGVPISPYLAPDRAWQFLTGAAGLARNLHYLEVNPRPGIAAQVAQVYTAGPVQVADLLYTCTTREGASKGYTMGISFGSRLNTNWSFRHITVAAPRDRFDAYAPVFAAMLQSYALDEGWARNYVQQGMERLRQMEKDTRDKIARNARDIQQIRQSAYDERQRSQDYLDYQRTQSIRGEQDWVSSVEGGTVYHSDTWGTRNTTTGETWSGQPYDYVHFTGANPKHREDMTPIDSRELWERHVR